MLNEIYAKNAGMCQHCCTRGAAACRPNVRCTGPRADIIAIWLFDEGEGGIVEDASGNPHDMDGTLEGGHWGVNPGEKPKWVDGKFGKALKCEGEGSVISIPNFNQG